MSGGDEWDDRPGMLDAVNVCKKGYLFLVRSYDRLFRDVDKALMFRAMMESKGVEVRSITEESANGDGMNAKLIRFIFLWIAEYQRKLIRARTRAKMLDHQKNGRRMSEKTPYGWKPDPADPKLMVKDYEEIATIDTMKQAWKEGDTLRAIARLLNHRGIYNRAGKEWHHYQIKRILVREGLIERKREQQPDPRVE